MVLVHAYKEGATEEIVGSNPTSGSKIIPQGVENMSKEFVREIRMHGGKAYGYEVFKYGLENGYLDYLTLSKIIGDYILNNTVRSETAEDWDMVAGEFDSAVLAGTT